MYPYILTSQEGQLLPIASIEKVKDEDKETIIRIIHELRATLDDNLYSVVLRGSVACGRAIKGISDLDMIIFPYSYSERQRIQLEALSARLSAEYASFYSLIDLSYVDRKEVLDMSKNIRMILNILLTGFTVYGKDIGSQIEPVFLSKDLAKKIANQTITETYENLRQLRKGLKGYSYMGISRDTSFFCIWIMRVICRGLIAPVMVTKEIFSLNVEAAGREFMKLYPEKADIVEQLLEWEKRPTNSAMEICRKLIPFITYYTSICKDNDLI